MSKNCFTVETTATKEDENLSMSIDSSFDEEISKADLGSDYGNLASISVTKVENIPGHLVVDSDDIVNSETVAGTDGDMSVGSTNGDIVSASSEEMKKNVTNSSDLNPGSHIPSHQNASVLSSNQQEENDINSEVHMYEHKSSIPKHTGNRLKRTPKSNHDQVKSSEKCIQSHSEKSDLVKSPEEIGTPGMTPQTPSSQQNRAVYQAKMARLLTYGSPSTLTPLKTPVSRIASKGFKPPAFVKK